VQRDPFVPPISKLSKEEARRVIELENLRERLSKDGFDAEKILEYYRDPLFKIEGSIINYFTGSPETPAAKEKLTYAGYRKKLGLYSKIESAPDFMYRHRYDLCQAEARYGVDKRYLAAIKGIESDFGNNMGTFKAFNALVSACLTPKKEKFYSQLKYYLRFCEKTGKSVFYYPSSYAGAIGPAQFMPSSIDALFIGKNGDFNADVMNIIDSIYSSAYYLKRNGWNPKLNNQKISEGTHNWRVLKLYNDSTFYVRAVIELANKAKWNDYDLKGELRPEEKMFIRSISKAFSKTLKDITDTLVPRWLLDD